jgi:hypothetical protein
MKLKYLNNEFIATKDLVTQYFYLFNEQVKYDATQVFNNYVKQGRTCLWPLMWSNQLLSDEMEALQK